MLIKSADDKTKRLKLLEDLQASPLLTREQKDWLHKELRDLRTGIKGERDAAHYIDTYYAENANWAVLHDLRIEVDGEVAQIDHLLLGRSFAFLLETKNFNGNISINEYGEFTVTYPDSGKSWGIPSPLEQSRRHERVLRKLLDKLDIHARTGGPLEIHHVVLLHPRGIIQRPDAKAFDSSNIIKADNLQTWHRKFVEKDMGVLKTLVAIANLRGQDTVREWAEAIKRQHRPADQLHMPPLMQPKAKPAPSPPSVVPAPAPVALHAPVASADEPALVCASCGRKLTAAVANFCRTQPERFNGQLYCMEHQKTARTPAKRPRPRRADESEAAVCAVCAEVLAPKVRDFCRKHPERFGGKLYCRAHQDQAA